jgi:FtsZ-binding cell division protein ZapB
MMAAVEAELEELLLDKTVRAPINKGFIGARVEEERSSSSCETEVDKLKKENQDLRSTCADLRKSLENLQKGQEDSRANHRIARSRSNTLINDLNAQLVKKDNEITQLLHEHSCAIAQLSLRHQEELGLTKQCLREVQMREKLSVARLILLKCKVFLLIVAALLWTLMHTILLPETPTHLDAPTAPVLDCTACPKSECVTVTPGHWSLWS